MNRFAALARVLVLALLAACGGDGDRSSAIDKYPVEELSGLVLSGTPGQTVPPAGDQVRATRGELDFRDGRTDAQGRYALSATQFGAPYLVVADGAALSAPALQAGSGTVNVSPLSDLLVKRAAFDAGVDVSPDGMRALDAAALDRAMRRLQDYLLTTWGVAVPADWRTFVTRPARAEPGDPLFDAVAALNRAWAERGLNGYQFDARLAYEAELARCRQEQVLLALGSREAAFCPLDRESALQPDGTVEDRFFNPAGETLRATRRDDRVIAVEFTGPDARPWRCEGSACIGAALVQAADGTRRLTLRGVALRRDVQPAGRADGGVTALPAGSPRLPCAVDYALVRSADGAVQGDCLVGNALAALGEEAVTLSTRTGLSGLNLEVRHDGSRLRSVVLFGEEDPSGEVLGWRCSGAACGSASLATTADGRRHLELPAAVLRAIGLDGAVLPGREVVLTLSVRVAVAGAGWPAPDCAAIAPVVQVLVDGTRPFKLCPNPIDELGDLLGLTLDAELGAYQYIWQHVSQGREPSAALSIEGSRVVYLNVVLDEGVNFFCFGDECEGRVRVGEPDAAGRRRVDFDATPLTERDVLNLPTGRRLTLQGHLFTVDRRCLDQDPCV